MSSDLKRSFEKLELRKSAVLSEVSTWSLARMRFRLEPDSWSGLQVLDHLVKVEEAFLGTVRSNLPNGRPVVMKERLGAFVVGCVMRSPVRIKVPTSAEMVLPETVTDITLLRNNWHRVRHEMTELFDTVTPEQIRRGLFRHPVSGWMTLPTAIGFLSSHISHHKYQLNRLKRCTSGL